MLSLNNSTRKKSKPDLKLQKDQSEKERKVSIDIFNCLKLNIVSFGTVSSMKSCTAVGREETKKVRKIVLYFVVIFVCRSFC